MELLRGLLTYSELGEASQGGLTLMNSPGQTIVEFVRAHTCRTLARCAVVACREWVRGRAVRQGLYRLQV